MNPEKLFHAALAQTQAERAAFLAKACAGDEALRRRVEELLWAHEHPGSFLADRPPLAVGTLDDSIREGPGTLLGPYQLLEQIGEGGFGVVFLAEQMQPVRRKVALKVLKPGMDTRQVVARFEAERQALAIMDHPNIAKVHDGSATPSGRPYFVMELVQGVPITDFCDQHRLTLRQRLELFIPVCQAVQHAHQKGVIHRDLKPSNVLVSMQDRTPVPKVIDFGVAKALGQELTDKTLFTDFAQLVGTPLYMSPEQAGHSGLDVDTRSDIYSLGVLLYELLTGTTPFDKDRLRKVGYDELRQIIREEEPPRPSTRISTLGQAATTISALRQSEPQKLSALFRRELDWIVMKALEKDRSRRYATADGLTMDVQRYLRDEPVQACSPSIGYRLRKFLRRNRGPVLAVGLVVLALVVGIVGTTYGLIRAEQQRGMAEAARANEAEQKRFAQEKQQEAEAATQAEARERALAVKQRHAAERARLRTRAALDFMTSAVTGESLMSQQEVRSVQKKFLSEVLAYYQEFAGEPADTELSRKRLAEAAYRVGLIEFRLGRSAEAVTAFDKARAGFAALAAAFPDKPAYRHELSRSHNNLGVLFKNRDPQAAVEHLRQALTLLAPLTVEFPEVHGYRQELARSEHGMGRLCAARGMAAEAETHYRAGLALLDQLAAELPKVRDHREELARWRNSLGILLHEMGKHTAAEEQFGQAVLLGQALVAEFPTLAAYRQQVGMSYHCLGMALTERKQHAQAEEPYRQALAFRLALVADFPGPIMYRQELARTQDHLAMVLHLLEQRAEAEELCRKAVQLRQHLASRNRAEPAHRQELACSWINLGIILHAQARHKEAEEQFRNGLMALEKLAAEFPDNSSYRQQLGCGHLHFGNLLKDAGKGARAEKHYHQGLALQEKLVAEFPDVPAYRRQLAWTHQCLGDLLQDLGKLAEAEEAFQKAETLKQNESGR